MRDPESRFDRGAPPLEVGQGRVQVTHAVDEHGRLAFEMVGEQ